MKFVNIVPCPDLLMTQVDYVITATPEGRWRELLLEKVQYCCLRTLREEDDLKKHWCRCYRA